MIRKIDNQSKSDTTRQTTANVPSQDSAKGTVARKRKHMAMVLHVCWNLYHCAQCILYAGALSACIRTWIMPCTIFSAWLVESPWHLL